VCKKEKKEKKNEGTRKDNARFFTRDHFGGVFGRFSSRRIRDVRASDSHDDENTRESEVSARGMII